MKGSKLLSAGKMEIDRSLARPFPLRTAVIHLRLTSISSHTAQLANLPGPPPPRLSSPLLPLRSPPATPPPSAAVAALLQGSCVSGAHNHRSDEASVGAGRFCCTLVRSHLSLFTNAAPQDRLFYFFLFSIPRLHLHSCAFDTHPDSRSTF